MDMQNVSNLQISEGEVRTIHDVDKRILWGRVSYETKYMGNIFQDGAPSPDSPQKVRVVTGLQSIEVTGKNICKSSSKYSNNAWRLYMGGVFAGKTLTISGVPSDDIENVSILLYYNDNGDNTGTIGRLTGSANTRASATVTLTQEQFDTIQNGNIFFFQLYKSGVWTTTTLKDVQIELGTETQYEPYQSGKYNVSLDGNLFNSKDFNAIPNGYDGSGVIAAGTTGANYLFWIPCKPNTAYSFRLPTATSNPPIDYKKIFTTSQKPAVGVPIYGLSSSIAKTVGTYENYVTGEDSHYLCVRIRGNNLMTTGGGLQLALDYLQIKEGATLDTSDDLELAKIGNNQDYIYRDNGSWYVHKTIGKYTMPEGKYFLGISGSSAGPDTQSAAGTFSFLRSDIGSDVYDSFMKNARFCNMAVYSDVSVSGNTGAVNLPDGSFTERSGTNDRIYYRNTALTGKTGREAGALFSGSFWYGFLNTPVDAQISNSVLVSQLDAIHQWVTRYGYSSVILGDLPIIIDKTVL